MPVRFGRLDYTHKRRHTHIPAQPIPPLDYAEILAEIAEQGSAVRTGIKTYRSRMFQRDAQGMGQPITFSVKRDGTTVYRFDTDGCPPNCQFCIPD